LLVQVMLEVRLHYRGLVEVRAVLVVLVETVDLEQVGVQAPPLMVLVVTVVLEVLEAEAEVPHGVLMTL
jgi:hypothetical protein